MIRPLVIFVAVGVLLAPAPATGTSVAVRGNAAFSKRALEKMIAGVNWDTRRDEPALKAIQDAYIRKGYLFATVRLERVVADSTIVLHVDEGEPARVGRLYIHGVAQLDSNTVAEALSVREGDRFNSANLDRGIHALLAVYDAAGFPFAQVWIDSLRLEPAASMVSLGIYVVEGESKQLRAVEFDGLQKTREELAVRLTGLRPGSRYDGGEIEEAYLRLSASGLFDNVEYPEIRVAPEGDGVEALIRVVETNRRNNFSFALGYADHDAGQSAVFSGMVQLEVNNIGGSLRDFDVFWRNDGADRSETRLGFRQRFLFGHPMSAGIVLEQIGLDTLYTWQSLGLEASAPIGRLWDGLVEVDVAVNGDRNTFSEGSVSKTVRLRLRGGLAYTTGRRERGTYFKVHGRGTYAKKSLDERDTGMESAVSQYITEVGLQVATEPFSHVHVTSQVQFNNIGSKETLVPLSEQYYIGGAATLRGYRENQFHSRRVGYARNEILLGRSRVEHGYVFLDVGYFLEEEDDGAGGITSTDRFKLGHGFGLRTASPAGRIDISFGLSEQFSLRQTKVHVILDRSF